MNIIIISAFIAFGISLVIWVRKTLQQKRVETLIAGIVSQICFGVFIFSLCEAKWKFGEALWRHRTGAMLVTLANLLDEKSKSKDIRELIFSRLNGDSKISFTQLQQLSQAMSALEISAGSDNHQK